MGTLEELQAEASALQVSLDTKQEAITNMIAANTTAVAGLQTTIEALQAQLGSTPTPEQIQSVIDSLEATKQDLESTVTS